MAGIAFINAIVFGVYGNVQRRFVDENSLTSHFAAGFTAGAVQSFVCSPMELAKTRMQLQGNGNFISKRVANYSGPFDCLVKMYKTEGTRGVFRGLGCSVLRDSPAFAVYFSSYEYLCRKMETQNGISTPVMLAAGGTAGILSWMATYPVDLIKSRLQADGMNGERKYKGIIDCSLKSYRDEGLKVFTRGLGSTIIRAFPTNAATFTVVTWIFRLCNSQDSFDLRREKHTTGILEKDIQRIAACVDTFV
ncbi:mitochondrial basic amino acids transporter-like [Centruroides sculpturatus]|uniref:mitochondrial basic amino acids transporter-like n=1 Tax=Centruroides sculpturatus TaxID=218467 RepID=UPI000C6DF9BE|nr:mitochondrial basic amino acids transporter-like [Centruroides sculpturatus]